ncbi:MAG: putative lipase [Pseudohongiellaceae bacterium]|jgi:predicted lipase
MSVFNRDFNEINWYAGRANSAYQCASEIQKKYPNTVHVSSLETIDVQYFLETFSSEKVQVVSVRGTANLKNVEEDAEYLQSKNPNLDIYVHKGFDRDAAIVYEDLKPHLLTDHQIKLTGHSLGAAISTILMMYLYEEGFSIARSINFGQPKVTNSHGVKKYSFLPLTRVADNNDLVPMVPPITLFDSIHGCYEHLGDEVILLTEKDYVYLAQHDATRKSIGEFWRRLGYESVEDHFMENYLQRIGLKLLGAVEVAYDRYK